MYSGVPKICLSLNCLQSLSIDRSYSVVVTDRQQHHHHRRRRQQQQQQQHHVQNKHKHNWNSYRTNCCSVCRSHIVAESHDTSKVRYVCWKALLLSPSPCCRSPMLDLSIRLHHNSIFINFLIRRSHCHTAPHFEPPYPSITKPLNHNILLGNCHVSDNSQMTFPYCSLVVIRL